MTCLRLVTLTKALLCFIILHSLEGYSLGGYDMANPESVESVINRLKKVEGQIRGVQRMIQGNRCTPEVIAQLMAIRSGLDQVGIIIMNDHISECMSTPEGLSKKNIELLQEAIKILLKFS